MRRILFRVALISVVVAPCVAWADALPGDPNDVYFHCTPAEQCPSGSEMCPATIGPAGQRPVEPQCAEAAAAKKLERRCYGKAGHLFCPPGATGSWKGKEPASTRSSQPATSAQPGQPQPLPPSQPKRGC